ncbi:hypothetical protein FHS60_001986 [Alloprevotella rava]|uniref:Uncharacterized protein n=1 Tax=Alloprevotella rava TaxID=671218 RepID=A0A7W5Y284_9BACT|nr:hypothetical protein [Alloprevotella rava]
MDVPPRISIGVFLLPRWSDAARLQTNAVILLSVGCPDGGVSNPLRQSLSRELIRSGDTFLFCSFMLSSPKMTK